MEWDREATAAVERAPFFLRRMVRRKVEDYVAARGGTRVTLTDVHSARQQLLGGTATELQAEPASATAASAGPTLDVPLDESELRALERLTQAKAGCDTRYYAVRACGAAAGCPLGVADCQPLADALAARLATSDLESFLKAAIQGPVLAHHKFRVVLAACANNCSEPQIADFAVIAQARPGLGDGECCDCGLCLEVCKEEAIELARGPVFAYDRCLNCGRCEANCQTGAIGIAQRGYDVLVGGKLGRHARLGTRALAMVDEVAVLRAFDATLDFYLREACGAERLGALLERVGWERFERQLVEGVGRHR
jgi:anaerobic sulfite reductase subunit C